MTSPAPSQVPAAPRMRKPGWRDTRLIIGLLLVLLSVAGVVALIQIADSRQGYWAAATDVSPGTVLTADDFTIVEANLSDSAQHYWPAEEQLPEEFVLSSTVNAGQLVPRSHVDANATDGRQQIAIRIADQLPPRVEIGSRVDLWISEPVESGRGFQAAYLGAESVELAGVYDNTGAFKATAGQTVYLVLDTTQIPAVLDAQVAGAQITLVPAVSSSSGTDTTSIETEHNQGADHDAEEPNELGSSED